MNLDHEDEVIGMQMNTQGEKLLVVTEKGMGKKTNIGEFTLQRRGGKGLKCYKITEKTGKVVGVKAVNEDHEVMMITTEGIIIQLRCDEISTYGRIASGVKLINLKGDVTVAKLAKVRQTNKVETVDGEEVVLEELPETQEEATDADVENKDKENDAE